MGENSSEKMVSYSGIICTVPPHENFNSRQYYALFPRSDSDVAKKRLLLLSVGLFPHSENDSDSDVTITKFGLGSVPIFSDTNLSHLSLETVPVMVIALSLSLCGNEPLPL